MSTKVLTALFRLAIILGMFGCVTSTLEELSQLIEDQEQAVLKFAKEVESQYAARCSRTLQDCSKNNYDNCNTEYPYQSCPVQNIEIEDCAGCKALFDYTVSNVRMAKVITTDSSDNPTDSEVKETICYGRHLDEFFISQNKANKASKVYGERLPQMYFGAHNGVFRIFPARHSSKCRSYDNRKRPWYVAASSGPKDIIIILDISGSMSRQDRISLAKQAAIDVISALTIGDHFGVVLFSDKAQTPEQYLLKASKENKQKMKDFIGTIQIGGGTNFYAGFKTAFDLLEKSVR